MAASNIGGDLCNKFVFLFNFQNIPPQKWNPTGSTALTLLFYSCALALKTHTVAESLLIKWKHNAVRRKKSVSYILYLRSNQWIDEHVQCSNVAARMEFSSSRILKGWYRDHNHHSVSCLMTNPLWFSSDKLLYLYHIHTCSAEFTPLRTSVEIHKMNSVINYIFLGKLCSDYVSVYCVNHTHILSVECKYQVHT
jgi:hypothetical protein